MRTKISNWVEFHGLQIPIIEFIKAWENRSGNCTSELPFKRDLRYWNNGPTSMQPKRMVHLFQSKGYGTRSICVFEIWERQDGFGTDVYRFDSIEDYNEYNPSNDMPHSIKHEIGLCENYHKGV